MDIQGIDGRPIQYALAGARPKPRTRYTDESQEAPTPSGEHPVPPEPDTRREPLRVGRQLESEPESPPEDLILDDSDIPPVQSVEGQPLPPATPAQPKPHETLSDINPAAVQSGDRAVQVASFNRYTEDGHMPMQVSVRRGTYTPQGGPPMEVYRWESTEMNSMRTPFDVGGWTTSFTDAEDGALNFADENDQEEPELDQNHEDDVQDVEDAQPVSPAAPDAATQAALKDWEAVFGPDGPTPLAMTGAPPDATFRMTSRGGGFNIEIIHPKISDCMRSVRRDQYGDLFVQNIIFVAKEKGGGLGAKMFSEQAKACAAAGVKYIKTMAAGSPSGSMNGYFTWPRFGFDQDIASLDYFDRTPIKAAFPDAKTVLDVFDTPGGVEWWGGTKDPVTGKRTGGHGVSLQHAVFDLTPGSRSWQVLEEYLEMVAREGRPAKYRRSMNSTSPPSKKPRSTGYGNSGRPVDVQGVNGRPLSRYAPEDDGGSHATSSPAGDREPEPWTEPEPVPREPFHEHEIIDPEKPVVPKGLAVGIPPDTVKTSQGKSPESLGWLPSNDPHTKAELPRLWKKVPGSPHRVDHGDGEYTEWKRISPDLWVWHSHDGAYGLTHRKDAISRGVSHATGIPAGEEVPLAVPATPAAFQPAVGQVHGVPTVENAKATNGAIGMHARPLLTERERQAMHAYSTMQYRSINAALRSGEWESERDQDNYVALQSAFAKAPVLDRPVDTVRSVRLHNMDPGKSAEFLGALQEAAKTGGVVTIPGMFSTSTNVNGIDPRADMVMRVKVHHGLDMRPYASLPKEYELLLNHKSTFRVLSITHDGTRYIVDVEQLVPKRRKT